MISKNEYLKKILIEFLEKKYKIKIDSLNSIEMDSREIEEGDLFWAINGGNEYAEAAIKKGARFVIYDSENVDIKKGYGLKVDDSIKFLQEFANYYRKKINPIVIAITGSNGKTTTKDILYSILSEVKSGKKTIENYNNHLGLPLSLLTLEKNSEFIVLEMGMRNLGEIELLSQIAEPDYGIITNIGESHLENLKTKENIFKAKIELVKYVKKDIVINGDDKYLEKVVGIKVGLSKENDIYARNIKMNEETTEYECILENKDKIKVKMPLIGNHNVLDSLLAIGIAIKMNIPIKKIESGLRKVKISKMRFEKIIKKDIIYLNDAYNASPISMKYSLETFSDIYNNGGKKIIVLGDMLELGQKSEEMHINLKEVLKNVKYDFLILYGNEMKKLYEVIKKDNIFYNESIEEIKEEIKNIKEKKIVLLKGSRGMKLEKIVEE